VLNKKATRPKLASMYHIYFPVNMGAHSLGQRHFKTAFKNKKVNGKPITFNSTRMQYELKKKKKGGKLHSCPYGFII